MDYLCPSIDRLVSCHTCGAQTLPPYRLCLGRHVGCKPCAKYLGRCACGHRFAAGQHSTFDCIVAAMKLRCKYADRERESDVFSDDGGSDDGGSDGRAGDGGEVAGPESGVGVAERPPDTSTGDDCQNRWFDVEELRQHYRSGCTRNLFTCPLDNCNFVSRVDTITEHYESKHGPYTELTPDDEDEYEVKFKLWTPTTRMQVIRKIFNGYFMIDLKPQELRKNQDPNPHLTMQNINPTDPLRYVYRVMMVSSKKKIAVTVSMMN